MIDAYDYSTCYIPYHVSIYPTSFLPNRRLKTNRSLNQATCHRRKQVLASTPPSAHHLRRFLFRRCLGVLNTVDGQNPAPPKDDNYPIIYRVLTIPEYPGDSSRDLFGMVFCDPFKGLSDLQLGYEKVTLNHQD